MNNQSNPERLLLDYAKHLERHRDGKFSIHLNLSKLKPQYKTPDHMRIAINTIESFVIQNEGQFFILNSCDIIIICRNPELKQINSIISDIEILFIQDPLIYKNTKEIDKSYFTDVINLEAEYKQFLQICITSYELEATRKNHIAQKIKNNNKNNKLRQLSPEQLGKLEKFLYNADISSLLHRQNICLLSKEMAFEPIFKELFISIENLAKTMLPDVNLAANQWLFQHLTKTLDNRVLKMLIQTNDSSLNSAFSLNLNISTLLSKDFLDFDANLAKDIRNTLVIEMGIVDIMSNFSDFVFARNFIRKKGYRTCLDGITTDMLPYINRQKMEFDLLKINADFNFESTVTDEKASLIKSQIEKLDSSHIILARCDNETMVSNGLKMGINMFQGYYIDKIQRSNKTKKITKLEKTRPALTAKR